MDSGHDVYFTHDARCAIHVEIHGGGRKFEIEVVLLQAGETVRPCDQNQ